MNGKDTEMVKISTPPRIQADLSSYDPCLQMAELEVQSNSQLTSQKNEIESYRQFGISKYLECEFIFYYKI